LRELRNIPSEILLYCRSNCISVYQPDYDGTNQIIPDPGRHGQRFYGAYSNRAGIAVSDAYGDSARPAANVRAQQDNSDFSREARSTWARLLRKILEVDSLLCACGARMRIPQLHIQDMGHAAQRRAELGFFHRWAARQALSAPSPPPISSCTPG